MGDNADSEGNLIHLILNDIKASAPVWEDFVGKASKLHSALKTTVIAADAFLDAFQRVADAANSSRGCCKDIGGSLTKMVIRHRSMDSKLKGLAGLLCEALIFPLQERLDDWKKSVIQMDKDHAKEYKKAKQDLKKATAETNKWQKKVKKGKSEHQEKLDAALKQASAQQAAFEEQEKRYLRKVLVEERTRYCLLASCFRPVVEHEISMLGEIEHLQSVLADIIKQTISPSTLPLAGEDLVRDFRLSDHHNYDDQSPPPSPTTTLTRATSPQHTGRDPPTTPPPPPPSETDPYFNAFSRHYSFSVKHSHTRNKLTGSVTPSTSPKKVPPPRICSRSTSFSVSSTSSQSSMSSLGSSIGSPSVESFPKPPTPLLSPGYSGDLQVEMPPPPPFPGAVSALPHPGDRTSWTTSTDSGCYSSSSGERSPSASLAQVYLPSSIAEHPRDDASGHYPHGPQYATPYAVSNTRTRCMSESASAMSPYQYGMAHRRSDSETSSQSSYSGNGDAQIGGLNSSDSGYFSYGGQHHRSNPENIQENSGGWTPQQKAKAMYNRSQSVSGRPSAAQQAQLAALASHAARSRSAPMPPARKSSVPPPCPERRTGLSDGELYKEEGQEQGGGAYSDDEGLSMLQKQIRRQKQLIQAKAKEKDHS
ncbi:MTSS1-like protein isoform X2 [Orbicella faveolata]|uniref:MTSS1-like protein isoform X2 n=1 Tax=Orbicella faveolata TaxID=48498 RepID=UPI0009E29702|nr:MTSS1-like protein isoform X2 [Orbicella faveolata]